MSPIELKTKIIQQVSDLNDLEKLEELLNLLQFQSEESIFETSLDEKLAIEEARIQISKGEFITNENFQKEIQEWLKR